MTPGENSRHALSENKPLQVVGTINAYCAMLAESTAIMPFIFLVVGLPTLLSASLT